MKKARRLLSIVLALALSLGLTALPVSAAEEPERGVLIYTEPIAPQYEDAREFSEGLAAVKKNGKWGYIDEENKVVIDFQYDYAWDFNEGKAVVGTGSAESPNYYSITFGFINNEGSYTPFKWSDGSAFELEFDEENKPGEYLFHNGMAWVYTYTVGYGQYICDANGSVVPLVEADGSEVYLGIVTGPMNEGLIPINSFDTFGRVALADASGKVVKRFEAELNDPDASPWSQDFKVIAQVLPFNRGLAPAWEQTYVAATGESTYKLGFLNKSYNWEISPQFDSYFYKGKYTTYQLFGETGLAMVAKGGLYGAIDMGGNTKIPFRYEELWPVYEGLILFADGGKYGYLDADTLEVVIPAQYENATGFSNGLAVAYDGSKAFLIDRKGRAVPGADKLSPSTYFTAEGGLNPPDEYLVIQSNGLYGYGRIEYLPALPEEGDMDSWAYNEVTEAIKENLVPVPLQSLYRRDITRSEFCDLVVQTIQTAQGKEVSDLVREKTGKSLSAWQNEYPFTDTSGSNVIAAYALGVVGGRGDGIFDPYTTITRQEAAIMLTHTAEVLGLDTSVSGSGSFSDGGQIASWASDAVGYVSQAGIMFGTGENNFSPLNTYTREQSYMTILRLFQAVK